MQTQRTLYGGWVEVVARGGNDHDGGDGDRGSEEGDDDEVLVWCTRSSDGDGEEERRLSPESDRKKGSGAKILWRERE
ncbi:hypothetical protein Tco_0266289, partial [Tanacetum coccineum]